MAMIGNADGKEILVRIFDTVIKFNGLSAFLQSSADL